MPSKYDFLQLSWPEFQFLCRDLIQQQLSKELGFPFVFNSFREGPDRGRDAVFSNEEHKIILQCKRYRDFKSLYANLKSFELEKIKRLAPCRYILATSVDLSSSEMDKVYRLLSPFVKSSSDIAAQKMLNSLLDLYPDIKWNYPQLYLDSADLLNRILHADIYHRSKTKLKAFHRISKFYVSSPSFVQAYRTLEQNRYVIISGDPGVGKTTMAGMLCLEYFRNGYEFVYVSGELCEADRSWLDGKKQIFLFDDFWGTPAFKDFSRNENRELFRFIEEVGKSTDKYLIITTREYVFRQAEKEYPEFRKLNCSKCVIVQREFSDSFKIHILFNYLYYSPVEYKHLERIVFGEEYRKILSHPHFSPRLLEDYIQRKYDRTDASFSFYWELKKYLDNPYEYWETVYASLCVPAQMLLLAMAITREPILEEMIFETFKRINRYRKMFEPGFEKDHYDAALTELSDSFITVSLNPDGKGEKSSNRLMMLILTSFHNVRYVEFQNPSIKDFAYYYLRKREDLIEILLKSAFAFNQLFHVFTTREESDSIQDAYAAPGLYAGKIRLSIPLQEVIIGKVLEEFDRLPLVRAAKRHWDDHVTTYHVHEGDWDNEMEKLYLLTCHFPLENVPALKAFVIEKYHEIIDLRSKEHGPEDYSESYPFFNTHNILSLEERISQVKVIKAISPYVAFDPDRTIRDYYLHIKFAKEYIALFDLGQLFPDAFRKVIVADMKNIRKRIKDLIISDIEEFYWEGSSESIDWLNDLIHDDLYTLAELYDFRLTRSYLKSLNEVAGKDWFDLDEEEHVGIEEESPLTDYTESEERVAYQAYSTLLHRLVPQWDRFGKSKDVADYIDRRLKEEGLDPAWRKKIVRFADRVDYNLLSHPVPVDLLMRYFAEHPASRKTLHAFYENCLDRLSCSEKAALQEIAFQLFKNEIYVLRRETLELLDLSDESLECADSLFETPLFCREDIWCRFFSHDFQLYSGAKYLAERPANEKETLYREFMADYPALQRGSEFFASCYAVDRHFVTNRVVIPELLKEAELPAGANRRSIVESYLQRTNFSYEYEFDKNENAFEFESGAGGDVFIEELCGILPLKTDPIFWKLDEYFNISTCKGGALKKYLQRLIPENSEKYTVDLKKEMQNPAFYPALESAGIPDRIVEYLEAIASFIRKHRV